MQQVSAQNAAEKLDPALLQGGSIFGALSFDAIRFLLAQGRVYRVVAGDVLFNPGDPGNSFFVVCQGAVDFYKEHDDDYTYTRTARFGEEIGFVAMISLQEHAGKAVARENGLVLELSSDVFAELHDMFPFDFGLMMFNLCRDMARVVRQLSDILAEHAIRY